MAEADGFIRMWGGHFYNGVVEAYINGVKVHHDQADGIQTDGILLPVKKGDICKISSNYFEGNHYAPQIYFIPSR